MSRALRSYPAILKDDIISTSAKEVPEQDVLLMATVENNQVLLSGAQNHTPDYQRVEQSDSESGVNSNSSADFPSPAQSDLKADCISLRVPQELSSVSGDLRWPEQNQGELDGAETHISYNTTAPI